VFHSLGLNSYNLHFLGFAILSIFFIKNYPSSKGSYFFAYFMKHVKLNGSFGMLWNNKILKYSFPWPLWIIFCRTNGNNFNERPLSPIHSNFTSVCLQDYDASFVSHRWSFLCLIMEIFAQQKTSCKISQVWMEVKHRPFACFSTYNSRAFHKVSLGIVIDS
jgi:hypothetical protein